MIPFYFGYILNNRTKALKKKRILWKNKEESQQQEASIPPISGNRAGEVCQGTRKPLAPSPLALWCVPALVLRGRALQPVERQTVLLAPTCSLGQSPGRSWPCGVPVILPTHGTAGTLLGECWPNPP